MRITGVLALIGLAGAFVFTLPAPDVSARPKIKTKYTYYTISGTSARKLYQQMISRGPHVSGDRALAATSAETHQSGDFVGGTRCRLKNYKISLKFTIRLPKVKNERSLTPRLRRNWQAFYKFVKRHEERHKQIWISCARSVERKVKAIRTKNCRSADRKANEIFRAVAASCEKKHDVFDRSEQKRLARHPLVVAAKRVPRRKKKALRKSGSTQKTNANRYVGGKAADDF